MYVLFFRNPTVQANNTQSCEQANSVLKKYVNQFNRMHEERSTLLLYFLMHGRNCILKGMNPFEQCVAPSKVSFSNKLMHFSMISFRIQNGIHSNQIFDLQDCLLPFGWWNNINSNYCVITWFLHWYSTCVKFITLLLFFVTTCSTYLSITTNYFSKINIPMICN